MLVLTNAKMCTISIVYYNLGVVSHTLGHGIVCIVAGK